ncbi:MAG TPA: dihydrolipoyl dehydrogenase [archaeon]|nr:dihydrolipoyl dehydrogenase [archaeon]
MAENNRFDLVILGGGPGGYVAAIKAAQEGLSAALVESDLLGGVCLNWGCIPSKALLASARLYENILRARDFGISTGEISYNWEAIVKRSRQVADRAAKGVAYLMKKNGITVFQGKGVLAGQGRIRIEAGEEKAVSAGNIILATGARPSEIPGIKADGETVITSREALALKHRPESIVIVGGGAIGMEFAYLFNAFGSLVTVVELLERILPQEDQEISEELKRLYQRKGMNILTGSQVERIETPANNKVSVLVKTGDKSESFECEKVLVAVGVRGNVEGIGCEEAGVEVEKGFIKVDRSYRTTASGIWAIGDCIGPPLLAHAASAEGISAVESILGRKARFIAGDLVPSCIYCQPQVASVGLTEAAALQAGHEVSVGRFPFRPLGKALALGERDGFVKAVVDKKSGKLLGMHILGPEATELIPEAVFAKYTGASAEEMHHAVHPHPTLSEALAEAVSAATGAAIHL